MLSSQTKDEVTHAAIQNLCRTLGQLTIDNVLSADNATLEAAICKVGPHMTFMNQSSTLFRSASGGERPSEQPRVLPIIFGSEYYYRGISGRRLRNLKMNSIQTCRRPWMNCVVNFIPSPTVHPTQLTNP